MLTVAIGHSEQVDTDDIIAEIIEQCEERLDGKVPQAGIVFASVDQEYDDILAAILNRWPKIQIIGCTTDGEVSSNLGFVEDSVSLTLFSSDTIEITTGIGKNVSNDVKKAAAESVKQARTAVLKEPVFAISLPTGLTANGDDLVNSIQEALGPDILLFGAQAGDQWRFEETLQFFNGEVLKDALPIILFSGPIQVSSGVRSGWDPIGTPGTVTRVERNVVYEIDNIPAVDFYQNLFGKDADPEGNTPFAVLDLEGKISHIRTSLSDYDRKIGSITFLGDVPNGAKVQPMVGNRERIIEGTRESVKIAMQSFPGDQKPDGIIYFSCAARKNILGTRTSDEFDILSSEVGEDLPVVGFYGYGEIGPSSSKKTGCEFHNNTFITVLFGEVKQ